MKQKVLKVHPDDNVIVALQVVSAVGGSRIPSLGTLFSRVMRTRSGRVGIVAGWAWLGLHFFAR